jgi:hypothetical protein
MGLKHVSFRGGASLSILGSAREVCVLYNYCVPIPSQTRDSAVQVLLAGGDEPALHTNDNNSVHFLFIYVPA